MELKDTLIYMGLVCVLGCVVGAMLRSSQIQNNFRLGFIISTKFWIHFPYLLIKILIDSDNKIKALKSFSFNLIDNLIIYNYYCIDKYAIKQGLKEIIKENNISWNQIVENKDLYKVYLGIDISKKVKYLIHDGDYFLKYLEKIK